MPSHGIRKDPGPYPFEPTVFPFAATVNGEPVVVWPDWIEREEPSDEPGFVLLGWVQATRR